MQDSSALALVLKSLAGDQPATLHSSEHVLIGTGLPTIPKPLLEKIQRWEYVDLVDLLPAPSSDDAIAVAAAPAHFSLFAGCEFVRHKKKQLSSVEEWDSGFYGVHSGACSEAPGCSQRASGVPADNNVHIAMETLICRVYGGNAG